MDNLSKRINEPTGTAERSTIEAGVGYANEGSVIVDSVHDLSRQRRLLLLKEVSC